MNSTAIKGIYSMFKEAFRSGVPELGEVLLDRMHNPAPRSELFPYRFFNKEKSIYYLDEGIAGFTFECNTIVGVKPEIYKQLSMLFDEQMPYGGVIEVLLLASDNIDPAIERWRKGRVKNEGVFKKLENYKSEFFKSYNKRKDKNFKHRDYRLFVSYSNKIDKKKGDKGGEEEDQALNPMSDSVNCLKMGVEALLSFMEERVTHITGDLIEPLDMYINHHEQTSSQ